MWSGTPDFSTSPHVTAFWCSWSLTLRGRPVSPLYFLPQLHGIAYTQSLVMFSSMGGVLLGRDICEVSSSFWRLSWCYRDCRSFVFSLITPSHKADRLFSECCPPPPSLVSAYPSFGELLPCTQGSCYVVGYYLYWPIFYLMSLGHHLWLFLSVVSSRRSLSLHWMVGVEIEVQSGECWFTVYGCLEPLLCLRYLNIQEWECVVTFFLHSEPYQRSCWVHMVQ